MWIFKNFLIVIFLIVCAGQLKASEAKVISCTYNYGNEHIILGVGTIKKSLTVRRTISSISYEYHIENINKFNETDDYVVIKDKSGKNITFFLKCE